MALRVEWSPGYEGPVGPEAWRLLWQIEEARVVARARTVLTELGTLRLPSGPVPVHRKVYSYRGIGALLSGAFRTTIAARGRARRERDALVRLRALGEPYLAPEPVALAERRSLGFLRAAILATRTVEGARELVATPSAPGVAEAAGTAAARMHAAGLADLELAPRNLLATRGPGGAWRIQKVDSARLRETNDPAIRAQDLADLVAGLESAWPPDGIERLKAAYAAGAGGIPPGLDAALPAARARADRRRPMRG